jgi:endoglucanase
VDFGSIITIITTAIASLFTPISDSKVVDSSTNNSINSSIIQENNSILLETGPYYFVNEDKVFVKYPNGTIRQIHLYGVNWFGFETQNHVVHGLWSRNYKEMLKQIKELGFNAIRLPFCTYSIIGNTTPTGIDYYKNPDLRGLNSLQVMKKIVEEANKQGIYVLLDYHTIGCNYIEPLWYTKDFSEEDFINVWKKVAEEFRNYPNVIGADLKNEPHSEGTGDSLYYNGATWHFNNKTDWNLAAERIGKEILKIAPNWLIFVEGTQVTNPQIDKSYKYGLNAWWGGNLMAVKYYPVNLPKDKLVYSPHVYGPDVYNQPYFNDPNFPNNMPDVWYHHFAYVKIDLKRSVIIGEFGGKFGENDPRDKIWQEALVDYMIKNNFCDFFYWSWNPNSGDTGGILKDDWKSVNWDKYYNLKRLMDYCSEKINEEEALSGALKNYSYTNENESLDYNNTFTNENTNYDYPQNQGLNQEITIEYPKEQWPTAFVDTNNDGKADFVMEINPWNIKSSQGEAIMTYKNGKITYFQNLRDVQLINPGAFVASYPEIYIGNKPWNGNLAGNILPLEYNKAVLSNLWASLSYKINNTDIPMNLAFETWLTSDKYRNNGIRSNEVELMIWFYWNKMNPAGSKIADIKIPIIVNNKVVNEGFEVWKGYIGWNYIAFRIKNPIKSANISFNFSKFLELASKYSNENLDNFYVEDLEVGTENGGTNNLLFNWTFSNFKLKSEDNNSLFIVNNPNINNLLNDTTTNETDKNNDYNNSNEYEEVDNNGDNLNYEVEQSYKKEFIAPKIKITNDWNTGFCANVLLENKNDYSIEWFTMINKTLDNSNFEITNIWNAKILNSSKNYYIIKGEEWNKIIRPYGTLNFGFCAKRTLINPEYKRAKYKITITSQWNTGFCANIEVINNYSEPIYWKIELNKNFTKLNNVWNANYQEESNKIIFTGVNWNNRLYPEQKTNFGFCANN